ncbi:hypothetical protein FRC96_21035 [Lujinxingia vulgaris]|uniref:Diacylglycerol glucosyltransferase N-terminal domain-containing protein n=1 Tax=Lujinxingia vulgaris TaxID=2600176 RepID=A0A5C6WZ63_9DELT|nr:hypothetical protein [Lujinxingia vulgaris]TXD31649.1 hypothetical protein FRC96_21035 [Lujinxingia vulgaris]
MTEVIDEASSGESGRIWILSDQRSREGAYEAVVQGLKGRGVDAELVSITEVLGTAAREALAGGAERLLRGIRVATRGHAGDEDFIGALRRARPDVLVLTSPRFVRALSVIESLTGVGAVQVGLVHEHVASTAWFAGSVHGFVVPDAKTAEAFEGEGARADRVQVAGPVVRPQSLNAPERDATRAELGLSESLVVLVRAEHIDHATLEKLVFQCTLMDRQARVIFHHGGDGAVAATLRRAADQYGLPASMFGQVADLERYVVAADLVLAAGDDPYLADVMVCGTPALLLGTSEAADVEAEALQQRGLAGRVRDVLRLGSELDRFTEPQRLKDLREQLLEARDGEANTRVVDALMAALSSREVWRKPASPEVPPAGEQAPAAGPFESIGRSAGADAGSTTSAETPSASPGATGSAGSEAGEKGALVVPPPRSRPEAPRATISAAEAREQLAQLILSERECERRLEELEKHQERWRGRLELAREWNEKDLEDEARAILRGYQDEAGPLVQELADIRRQKEKLKSAARGGAPQAGDEGGAATSERSSQIEERFQRMEVDRDLKGLKDRIKRELGE